MYNRTLASAYTVVGTDMTHQERPDPIHQLAVRLYAIHRVAIQLGEDSPLHLESDFNQVAAKIEVHGGKIKQHTDPIGTAFPVVTDVSGNAVPYDAGRIESERLLEGILAARRRQS